MRGLLLGVVFFSLLPLIFLKSAYIGILMWFWISLMNPQKVVWSSIFATVDFSFIVAVATLACWLFSQVEPKLPPFTRTTKLLLLLMIWVFGYVMVRCRTERRYLDVVGALGKNATYDAARLCMDE